MTTKKKCPTCGVVHVVEMQHEWAANGSRRELTFIQQIDSSNIDGIKLESLVPLGPSDGQELAIEAKWLDDRSVMFKIFRRPAAMVQAPIPVERLPPAGTAPKAPPSRRMNRADMETRAAEIGLEVDAKWNDAQLAKQIADKEKA